MQSEDEDDTVGFILMISSSIIALIGASMSGGSDRHKHKNHK